MSKNPSHVTPNGLPIVRTHRDIVGNLKFDPVELEIVGKRDEGAFFGPALAIHYEMVAGESRRPMIISPQMVLPTIAFLASWLAQVTGDGIPPTDDTDGDESKVGSGEVPDGPETPADPFARKEGETRGEWDARLAAMLDAHNKETDQ